VARARGLSLEGLSPAAWDALWVESKRAAALASAAAGKPSNPA
jgi:hypothetical protein